MLKDAVQTITESYSTAGIAIRVEGLSKKYKVRKWRGAGYLRDTINEAFQLPVRTLKKWLSSQQDNDPIQQHNIFWALKDISFELKAGQVLGIVGKNGSGKSTLMKILSRITRPTTGYFEMYGRAAALLEVGTGFHPELTGRENVYLNGSILGMTRREIDEKFDNIIAFSEIEDFIDTPVKRYSSGMYVRLAFSIAAHLDTDILILDEVLAVGDLSFRDKSLNKMKSVTQDGRTVILVSHDGAAIRDICTTVMWLERGNMRAFGPTAEVMDKYEQFAVAG